MSTQSYAFFYVDVRHCKYEILSQMKNAGQFEDFLVTRLVLKFLLGNFVVPTLSMCILTTSVCQLSKSSKRCTATRSVCGSLDQFSLFWSNTLADSFNCIQIFLSSRIFCVHSVKSQNRMALSFNTSAYCSAQFDTKYLQPSKLKCKNWNAIALDLSFRNIFSLFLVFLWVELQIEIYGKNYRKKIRE